MRPDKQKTEITYLLRNIQMPGLKDKIANHPIFSDTTFKIA